jgi:hypothetical protein
MLYPLSYERVPIRYYPSDLRGECVGAATAEQVFEAKRLGKIVALAELDIELSEEFVLSFVLDAFGDDLEIERARETYDRLKNLFLLSVDSDSIDEAFVDFETPEWQAGESCQ